MKGWEIPGFFNSHLSFRFFEHWHHKKKLISSTVQCWKVSKSFGFSTSGFSLFRTAVGSVGWRQYLQRGLTFGTNLTSRQLLHEKFAPSRIAPCCDLVGSSCSLATLKGFKVFNKKTLMVSQNTKKKRYSNTKWIGIIMVPYIWDMSAPASQ